MTDEVRYLYPSDPGYPTDEFRSSARITMEIECVHDGRADDLAEDLRLAATRWLRDHRQADVLGSSSAAQEIPLLSS